MERSHEEDEDEGATTTSVQRDTRETERRGRGKGRRLAMEDPARVVVAVAAAALVVSLVRAHVTVWSHPALRACVVVVRGTSWERSAHWRGLRRRSRGITVAVRVHLDCPSHCGQFAGSSARAPLVGPRRRRWLACRVEPQC